MPVNDMVDELENGTVRWEEPELTPADTPRCEGKTRRNTRCKKAATEGSHWCSQHEWFQFEVS